MITVFTRLSSLLNSVFHSRWRTANSSRRQTIPVCWIMLTPHQRYELQQNRRPWRRSRPDAPLVSSLASTASLLGTLRHIPLNMPGRFFYDPYLLRLVAKPFVQGCFDVCSPIISICPHSRLVGRYYYCFRQGGSCRVSIEEGVMNQNGPSTPLLACSRRDEGRFAWGSNRWSPAAPIG